VTASAKVEVRDVTQGAANGVNFTIAETSGQGGVRLTEFWVTADGNVELVTQGCWVRPIYVSAGSSVRVDEDLVAPYCIPVLPANGSDALLTVFFVDDAGHAGAVKATVGR
jgi:hypothetical protein